MSDELLKKKISIVIPTYNEQDNIEPLINELEKMALSEVNYCWHIQFVDDCSVDNTWSVMNNILQRSSLEISAIRFSANFGKEPALVAGLKECCTSDAVIFMDADLQHPPELIPKFVREWEKGSLNVSGVRKHAADYSFFKSWSSKLFYKIMDVFSDIELPRGLTDFKLIDRKIVIEFLNFKEKALMFRGLIEWLGFSKSYIEFDAPARLTGEAAYSYKKLYQLAVNSFTSFSLLPLKITGTIGGFILFCSFFLLAYMLISSTFGTQVFTPVAYFIVFNTLLTGTVLTSISFVAIYIGRIHVQVIDRPLYVISEKYDDALKSNDRSVL